jgi:hypothetical protein
VWIPVEYVTQKDHIAIIRCLPEQTRSPFLPWGSGEILCRGILLAALVASTYQFGWDWLRFLTSETISRMSGALGMSVTRISLDTVRVDGEFYQFAIPCTFVDAFIGAIPLLWDLARSFSQNVAWFVLRPSVPAPFGHNSTVTTPRITLDCADDSPAAISMSKIKPTSSNTFAVFLNMEV